MPGALHGFRIIDVTAMLTGPMATMILADQGACVVKVEPPGLGDVIRFLGTARGGMSAFFANCNRGKRSVVLNLRDDRGREVLGKLVGGADVFVQNFRPGVVAVDRVETCRDLPSTRPFWYKDPSPMYARSLRHTLILGLLLLLGPLPALADDVVAPSAEDAFPVDSDLSGKEIYRRVLRNRLHSYDQDTVLTSGDRSGAEQETEITVRYKSFKDENDQPVRQIHSKTRLEYTKPFDLRYTAYLVIDKEGSANDQFVYLPTYRRVRRVNLRGEALFGTDFSFEDVLPRELEDATYKRLPNEVVDGVPCFAVEAIPGPEANSEYSRFVFVVEMERYVPLLIRYWDEAGVKFKELHADHDSIQQFENAWIPMRSTMRNLLQESWSKLRVVKLIPNPEFSDSVFSVRSLERR